METSLTKSMKQILSSFHVIKLSIFKLKHNFLSTWFFPGHLLPHALSTLEHGTLCLNVHNEALLSCKNITPYVYLAKARFLQVMLLSMFVILQKLAFCPICYLVCLTLFNFGFSM
jgi:hypothetical protein